MTEKRGFVKATLVRNVWTESGSRQADWLSKGLRKLAFFEVLQAGVEDFFDAAKLGGPGSAHFVEAVVHVREAGIDVSAEVIYAGGEIRAEIAHTGIVDQYADQHRDHHWGSPQSNLQDGGFRHLSKE